MCRKLVLSLLLPAAIHLTVLIHTCHMQDDTGMLQLLALQDVTLCRLQFPERNTLRPCPTIPRLHESYTDDTVPELYSFQPMPIRPPRVPQQLTV